MISYEQKLSPGESLAIITDAISKSKENIRTNSFPFLLWGIFIAFASFSMFLLHQYTSYKWYFIPFPILVGTGIIITLIWYTRSRAQTPTETYVDYFLSRLWMVLGISFITIVFISISQNLLPFTYTLIVAFIGTFVSGLVMKFKPLIVGGILFLLSAIGTLYVPDNYKVLLHGVAIIAGYIIPGYLLKNTKV